MTISHSLTFSSTVSCSIGYSESARDIQSSTLQQISTTTSPSRKRLSDCQRCTNHRKEDAETIEDTEAVSHSSFERFLPIRKVSKLEQYY